MLQLTRRHALALLGGSIISPLLPAVPAAASPLVVAMAIVGAASTIVEMMKQGGSMELMVQSLDVKLDEILDNQLRMMAAIAAVDQKISDIQKIVSQTPIETLGLSAQISAADATKNAIRTRNDGSAAEYERHRQQVIDEASRIESSSRSSVTTPSLAVAAWHALNGLLFIKTQEYGGKSIREETAWFGSDEVRKALIRATDDLRGAFSTLLTPESVLSQRLAETRKRIDTIDSTVIATNASAGAILPKSYLDNGGDPIAEPQVINDVLLCVRRNEPTVQTEVTDNSYCSSGTTMVFTPDAICGGSTWSRESVSYRRMHVTVMTRTVPGGRKLVAVTVATPEEWQRGVWSREVNKAWGVRVQEGPRNVADIQVLDGCVDLSPLAATEHPDSLVHLINQLDVRNALAIQEGNLVNLQGLCERALKRCDEVDGGNP